MEFIGESVKVTTDQQEGETSDLGKNEFECTYIKLIFPCMVLGKWQKAEVDLYLGDIKYSFKFWLKRSTAKGRKSQYFRMRR